MADDRHEFFVEVSADYARLQVACPYQKEDQTRPCWPYHEDGDGCFTVRDQPPQTMCTYEDYVDNLALDDIVHGARLLPLGPVQVEWDNGGLELHL